MCIRDRFTFYRVPKVLFTNERFWNISADAKMLYGILLDRMSPVSYTHLDVYKRQEQHGAEHLVPPPRHIEQPGISGLIF